MLCCVCRTSDYSRFELLDGTENTFCMNSHKLDDLSESDGLEDEVDKPTNRYHIPTADGNLRTITHCEDYSAEISFSDAEFDNCPFNNYSSEMSNFFGPSHERKSFSAYGDGIFIDSTLLSASRATLSDNSSMTKFIQEAAIHISMIHCKDRDDVIGKLHQARGLRPNENTQPGFVHARVHVTVLPMKKYALKTPWRKIRNNGTVNFNEYFKYEFHKPIVQMKTAFRVRLYARKGIVARKVCLGETCVPLVELKGDEGGSGWKNLGLHL